MKISSVRVQAKDEKLIKHICLIPKPTTLLYESRKFGTGITTFSSANDTLPAWSQIGLTPAVAANQGD